MLLILKMQEAQLHRHLRSFYLVTLLRRLMSHAQVRSGILEPFQKQLKVVRMEMCPSEIMNTFFQNRNCKNFSKTEKKGNL